MSLQFAKFVPAEIQEGIDCVFREIAMRKKVYPRRIEAKKMSPAHAAREIEAMEQVAKILIEYRQIREKEVSPSLDF